MEKRFSLYICRKGLLVHASGTRETAVDRFTVAATMGACSGGGQCLGDKLLRNP